MLVIYCGIDQFHVLCDLAKDLGEHLVLRCEQICADISDTKEVDIQKGLQHSL